MEHQESIMSGEKKTRHEGDLIKAIDSRSIHQICSGQVILSLATAVKELVENSIDACATNVEIKLKEYGIECIEVHDNGSGIEEKDFEAIGLKHYTSKLKDFSDLAMVETFGFRGEALSSLCALSKLVIITRHRLKEFGSKLEFDYNGMLTSKVPCARECGTTVVISNLFHTLPVRHKEFQRNIKKEFPKLSEVLQAYGIISTSIRISCINVLEKRKNVVLSTHGCNSMIDNIANVFGPKQIQNLLEFVQETPSEEMLQSFNISSNAAKQSKDIFSVKGYISRTDPRCGRSSPDRQFFFINKRPCDMAKISRAVNEAYRTFNRHQYPFVVLNVSLNSEMVDVNITPDKRQLFIQNERLLLATLKTSLLKMFEETAGQYQMNTRSPLASGIPIGAHAIPKNDNEIKTPSSSTNASPLLNLSMCSITPPSVGSLSSEADSEEDNSFHASDILSRAAPARVPSTGNRNLISSVLNNFRSRFSTKDYNVKPGSDSDTKRQTSMEKFAFKLPKKTDEIYGNASGRNSPRRVSMKIVPKTKSLDDDDIEDSATDPYVLKLNLNAQEEQYHDNLSYDETKTLADNTSRSISAISDVSSENPANSAASNSKPEGIPEQVRFAITEDNDKKIFDNNLGSDRMMATESVKFLEDDSKGSVVDSDVNAEYEMPRKRQRIDGNCNFPNRPVVQIHFDMEELRKNIYTSENTTDEMKSKDLLGFRAKIAPSQNNAAEEELRRNITKNMFSKMEVVGQFNLGFIIAKLKDDLFIIDQHATDEKYNFERLQQEHCLKGQRLIRPRQLELTPVNESILIDNLHIFQKNGFDFIISEDAPATKKVSLVSLPTSRNWTFDVDDIEELIFMLSDTPGVVCRPSRVRSMFASRACRMSTMVGSALNCSQMKILLNHMAEIEHPWNCPHGRPTMRHLVSLKRIETNISHACSEE